MTIHTEYDGCVISASHIGRHVQAWATHAWDDWYYIVVSGTYDNGNVAKGVYCREQAHTVRRYLVYDELGLPLQSLRRL